MAYRKELGVRACSRSFSLCRRPLSAANGLHPDGDSVRETYANGGRRTSRRRISSEACRLQSVWSPGDTRCSMYMVHETLLWVNSMMTFLLVFTVPHSLANSDFECSSMVQSLQQPLRPQVSKHGQGVSCLAPLGLMFSAGSTSGIEHQREHGHSKLLFPVVCFFLKEPAGSLRDGGYDLSSGHTLLKYLFFSSLTPFPSSLSSRMPRLCVRVRVYVWVRVFIDFPYWRDGNGNGGRFVRSFCLSFFFFSSWRGFCVPLVTVVQCLCVSS